MEEFHVNNF